MDRALTQEEKEKVINCGAFSYENERMAIVLDWSVEEVDRMMKDKKSELYRLYNKGLMLSEYVLMTKLFEMAKSGDIKALDKLEQMQRKIKNRKK